MGEDKRGVLYGFEMPVPASGLTGTYSEGLIRVGQLKVSGVIHPTGVAEFRVAGSTKLFTASKDTYAHVDNAGVIQYTEKTLGATKPTQVDIGADSEFIWKVVTDGSDVTAVTSLRQQAGGLFETKVIEASFVTADEGTQEFCPGFRGRIIALDGTVSVALAATDAGAITPSIIPLDDVGVAVTNGALSFALSAAVGVRDIEIPSAADTFNEFERISLVAAKTTTGGLVVVTVVMERF